MCNELNYVRNIENKTHKLHINAVFEKKTLINYNNKYQQKICIKKKNIKQQKSELIICQTVSQK